MHDGSSRTLLPSSIPHVGQMVIYLYMNAVANPFYGYFVTHEAVVVVVVCVLLSSEARTGTAP
jgi:hypothetical protein